MTTIINAYAPDDSLVGTLTVRDAALGELWKEVVTGPFYVIDISSLPQIPKAGDVWSGSTFETITGPQNTFGPDFKLFAFVVNGEFKVSHALNIDLQSPHIAAYMAGPRFELVSDE